VEEQGKGNYFNVKEGEVGNGREISMRWPNEKEVKVIREN
jgi:hypothetical protein